MFVTLVKPRDEAWGGWGGSAGVQTPGRADKRTAKLDRLRWFVSELRREVFCWHVAEDMGPSSSPPCERWNEWMGAACKALAAAVHYP